MLKQLKKKLEIMDIKDDLITFRDGGVMAVFSVKAVDFEKISEDERLMIICNYRLWLDNIDYPVQIVKRAVNWNNREHLLVYKTKTETELKKRKKDSQDALAKFRDFYTWLVKHVNENCSCSGMFYLVIPYLGLSKKDVAKEWEDVKEMLNSRCENSKKLLEKTGVKLKRMDGEDLENLFSSYFDMFFMEENKENYDDINSFAKLWIEKGDENE